ncbi:hypothetical protein [Candidatus Epulonipiscium viviparus]|uniref:hypothetical protein n=1 Tax=Candidatus Epulonipiscium viviparus TaxID=420336 RepID=UPI00016C0458|nr:hypothetical protein [Candidatus Epulopiscium viviparus]
MKILNPMPLIRGLLLSMISMCIALVIVFPEIRNWFIINQEVILNNMLIGISILPVFMIVVLKDATNWYKKFSSWFTFILSGCAIVATVLYSTYGWTADEMTAVVDTWISFVLLERQ